MRPPLFFAAFAALLTAGCETQPVTAPSTALPVPSAELRITTVTRDYVRIVWDVVNGEGRKFEILRQNKLEPFKHYATVSPVEGAISLEDTGVVPGQRYVYRLRLYGSTGDQYLVEVRVAVPL